MSKYNNVDCCFDCKKQFNNNLCQIYCKDKNSYHTNSCVPGECINNDFKKKDTVTIALKEYEELVRDSNCLKSLRANGVDCFDGYDEVLDCLNEWDRER